MPNKQPVSPEHARLETLRDALLALHKSLMDSERVGYEAVFGTITSNNHFLSLLLQDPWFAWLRPVSALLAVMDETLDAKDEPVSSAAVEQLTNQVRSLLKASDSGVGFEKNYYDALQRDPDVVMAHAAVAKLIHQPPNS
ncbi:MAG TPA: hypothetical protein VGE41_04910 [Verrucomicrobiae bacterium]